MSHHPWGDGTKRFIAMMKKLLLGGMLSAALFTTVSGAEAPQLTPEQQAQLMQMLQQQKPAIKIEDAVKDLPAVPAKVNGKDFTKADLVAALKQQFSGDMLPGGVTAEMVKERAGMIVTGAVTQKLMQQAMKNAGFVPSAKLVKDLLAKSMKDAPKEEIEAFNKYLASQKKTLDQFIDERAKDPKLQEGAAMQMFMEDKVLKGISATEADALKYYNENKARFVEPKVDAAAEKAALDKTGKLLAELKANPAKFAELAKANSKCGSKDNGGSLGAFGKGQMVPEFEKAAYALKVGELSAPVKTQFGYHIIRRDASDAKDAAGSIRASHILIQPEPTMVPIPFDKVKADLVAMLTAAKQREAMQAFSAKLLKDANFKLMIAEPAKK